MWPSSAPLPYTRLQNVSDFDLWRTHKVKSDGPFTLLMYDFLSMFNTNIGPNSAPLRDTRFQNQSDLDLQGSFNIKYNGTFELPIYDFLLLVKNSNHVLISRILSDVGTWIIAPGALKISTYFWALDQHSDSPQKPVLTQGRFFVSKWSWLVKYVLQYFFDRQTNRPTWAL